MSGSIYDLLRDIRRHAKFIDFQNTPATVDGRPVMWRWRGVDVEGDYAMVSFSYDNWTDDGTHRVRGRSLDLSSSTASVEELWSAWERLKLLADGPSETDRMRLGQLDLLDLIASPS